MVESWFLVAVAGALGLMIGSFLNVCTLRWPNDLSVVSPPSHCPKCDEAVRWYDNIPVASYLVLRGRCRWCKEPISIQYPLVELATGIIWAGCFAAGGLSWESLRGATFLTILFGISVTDARYYIIPDEFSLGGAVLGMGMSFFPGAITPLEALFGAVVGFAILWGVGKVGSWIFKKDAMGGGDIKMMAMVGTFLGIPGVLLTIFLGALLGSVIFGPISWKTKKLVPFGIFLAAGAALAYTWGGTMVEWYMTTILRMPPS